MESTSSNELPSPTQPDCSDHSKSNKVRLAWTPELHLKFVKAVKQLGVDKAVPKAITEIMNVEGLTRRQVASHLQKYRNFLKTKNSGDDPQVVGKQMPRQQPRQTVVQGFGGGPEIPYLGLDDIMMRNFGNNLDVWNDPYLVCNERRLDLEGESRSRSRENRGGADSADDDRNGGSGGGDGDGGK